MRSKLVLVGGVAWLTGCGLFAADAEQDAPPDLDVPAREAPPPVTGTPGDAELTEAYGVFVVAGAPEGGDGTRARPVGTLAEGIALAKNARKRVYVCSGTYAEAIGIEDGVSMLGGLDCSSATWRSGEGRSRVVAPSSPAARAEKITTPTRFERFEVIAPDAREPSGSSIGLFARDASALVVADARIVAGKGAAGADGTPGTQLVPRFTPAGAGHTPRAYCRGSASSIECRYPARRPGVAGGTVQCEGAPGHDGEPGGRGGSPGVYAWLQDSSGDLRFHWYPWQRNDAHRATAGEAKSGAAGASGAQGASAAAGVFGRDGFAPGDGLAGTDGAPGKGGRGGDGRPPVAAPAAGSIPLNVDPPFEGFGGSGGGAGGCPGLAGTPGKGGGASVAAYLVASAMRFEESELVADDGGAGGKGTFGTLPSMGGAAGGVPGGAQPGTRGGAGGSAGVSGSGAGGPSVALAHTGAVAVLVSTETKHGKGGAGVPAMTSEEIVGPGVRSTKTLGASSAGLATKVHAF